MQRWSRLQGALYPLSPNPISSIIWQSQGMPAAGREGIPRCGRKSGWEILGYCLRDSLDWDPVHSMAQYFFFLILVLGCYSRVTSS